MSTCRIKLIYLPDGENIQRKLLKVSCFNRAKDIIKSLELVVAVTIALKSKSKISN